MGIVYDIEPHHRKETRLHPRQKAVCTPMLLLMGMKARKKIVCSPLQLPMVYAGNNYWIDRQEWSKLFSAPTDARFCKLAALLFWTPEELRERSVTGAPSNRSLSSGKFYPRQPLSPEKLATVKGHKVTDLPHSLATRTDEGRP
ncbi:hypothetical protein MRX96_040325 [Rhipicephalus microplus]